MKWEEPPGQTRAGGGQVKYQHEASALRKNPGRWAVLRTFPVEKYPAATSFAQSVTRGVLTAFRPARAFEVKVYARYTGEQEAGSE